jgi:RinA family phage transcriptional activator
MMAVAEKLKPATFKHIEAELYGYNDTKREIMKRREELMYPFDEDPEDMSIVKGANSVRTPGRPTERIVTRLTMDKRLRNLEEIIEAIDSVLDRLDGTQRKMVNLRYFMKNRKLNWEGIALECNIHVQTAFKYRRMIIQAIAEKVGWR